MPRTTSLREDTGAVERGISLNGHEIALWSAVAAFFGYLLAVGFFDLTDWVAWTQYLGAFIVAGITAGAVYAQQRLSDAKKAEKASAPRKRGAS